MATAFAPRTSFSKSAVFSRFLRRLARALVVAALSVSCTSGRPTERGISSEPTQPLPRLLSETGLFLSGTPGEVDPQNLGYEPAYPLWTDGAEKRRFLRLPEGGSIDASSPDDWNFPVGTRLWKEFSFGGKRVETRMLQRMQDGSVQYAAYVWRADGSDAELAPEIGVIGVATTTGSAVHDVPGLADCRACHEGRQSRVLGFNAVQLGSRLQQLSEQGVIENLPPRLLRAEPPSAGTNHAERAALGYLFGNCAHCHNRQGPIAALGLDLDQSILTFGSGRLPAGALGVASHFRLPGSDASLRVARGAPDASLLLLRMKSRDAASQMPPLGTHLVDPEGVRLVERLIAEL